MPKRIQRKRTKGWRMPKGAVYVGRPTKWGNPYRHADPNVAVEAYRGVLIGDYSQVPGLKLVGRPITLYDARRMQGSLHTLRGRDLVCWCPLDQPCHADVLLELANREPQ